MPANAEDPLSPALRFRLVATIALAGILLGALMILTPPSWYPIYLPTAQRWGLTPIGDQRLTGIVLLLSMGLVYVSLTATSWRTWRGQERSAKTPQPATHLARSTAP